MLARALEDAGLSTILVTMMPVWAERIGTPRTLAVEFPFTQTLGQPGNITQQLRVLRQALHVLETAQIPGTLVHSSESWPEPLNESILKWQPPEPSPIVGMMGPHVRELLRERRKKLK